MGQPPRVVTFNILRANCHGFGQVDRLPRAPPINLQDSAHSNTVIVICATKNKAVIRKQEMAHRWGTQAAAKPGEKAKALLGPDESGKSLGTAKEKVGGERASLS